uniref:AlNc14C220G9099 protein n=1 Tax=Albugo laibachii Nc14 TaxID=890382 RepID=F0WRV7_9STRA|nr:AlNc14C220G9099 [Albugo laibachii Nc14]|eukprot:CCA24073.1 AlNc14C220G9099 [Albugo laibachii Nc14]
MLSGLSQPSSLKYSDLQVGGKSMKMKESGLFVSTNMYNNGRDREGKAVREEASSVVRSFLENGPNEALWHSYFHTLEEGYFQRQLLAIGTIRSPRIAS